MSNTDIISNKISAIEKYLILLRAFKAYTEDQIKQDTTLSGAVERYAYLAAQATIDLAEAFISFKGFRKPTTMSESFYILNENKIIDQNFMAALIKMVGFRNILAHDYDNLDVKILYSVLTDKTVDLETFVQIIRSNLSL